MPLTPETWLPEFTVNTGNQTGNQREPQITQLSNGNILVAWEDDTNNVDSENGTDIIGQIYDPMGEPVGSPFQMNTNWYADDEGEFEIAATPGGGWILAYEDTDTNGTSIGIEVYDSTGSQIDVETFLEGTGESFNDPTVTVNDNGDAVVAWNVDDGSGVRASYSFYDASTETFSTPSTSFLASGNTSTTGGTQNLSVAALSNGSFVLVAPREFGSDDIVGRLITASGASGGGFFTISASGTEATQPDVAALEGGGFVAVWQNFDGDDRDAVFRIFDNSGTAVTGERFIDAGSLDNNNNELSVTGLTDGGFAVVYDNDEDNTIDMVRYDDGGTQVGSVVTINSAGVEQQPEIIGLSDGRIAVTWQESDTGQDVRMAIYDTRDTVNSPVYTPDDYQIGTVGDDSFTATADFAFGHDGDDAITDGGGTNQIDAGAGNDTVTILGVDADETVDGGSGIDTLIGQSVSNGTVYDLAAQEVRSGSTTQSALNFENVTGTAANEALIGNFADNTLLGGGGDDTIRGNNGIDVIEGGDGNDVLFGGSTFDDTLLGGAGNDTLEAVGGGLIDGGSGDDLFVVRNGNVIGDTNTGDSDLFDGGAGNDTFDASNETSRAYTIDLGAQTIDRGAVGARTVQIVDFEHLIGTGLDDTLNAGGQSGTTIEGGNGNDSIIGGFNSQDLRGGRGDDTIDGGVAAGSSIGDLIDGGFGNDSILGADGSDTIFGGRGDDTIEANDGNNDVSGGKGNDRILAGSGNDTLDGNAGDDLILAGGGDDTLIGRNGADDLRGGSGDDYLRGLRFDDTLRGQGGDDLLEGGDQQDLLLGGSGNDTLRGGQGPDTLRGNDDDDRLEGGQGADVLDGDAGNDRLFGGAGRDFLDGGAGDDFLTGGQGNDTFIFSDGFGQDRIFDFEATNNNEQIDLSNVTQIPNYANLVNQHMYQQGSNVIIDAEFGNTIRLDNVDLTDLDQNDFVF